MMLQSKLDVLTTTALQSDTIYGELGSLKKKERTNSILYGPALLLLLAACGGGGGGGGTVSVSSPEPADTDDTPAVDARIKVGAGPADADGVHRATTDSTKIDIDAEAVQPVGLSAIYKSGDDDADITLEFVDQQNQLSHVFTISNGADGDLDITVDNKKLFIKFGEDTNPDFSDDLSGSNNYASFIDGGQGDDALSGGENEDNLFGFSGDEFGNDTIVNPSPKSEGYINSGDIISFINFVLRRPTDDVELRDGLSLEELVTPSFKGENLVLLTDNGSTVTVNNGAYLDIGIRSSHGDVENFIYALSSPDRDLRGTNLPDIIFGRGGEDTIKGLAGNDEIIGGAGNDTIDAGYGDDYIEGGAGADDIDGSFGIDTASYINSSAAATSSAGVQVDWSDDAVDTGGDAEGDILRNIQNLIGSAYDDTLIGDDGDNKIEGHKGDDEIKGLGGEDELHGGEGRDAIYGGADNDTFVAYIENGASDTITDFTDGDKVRIDVDNPSAIFDLTSLYAALSITATNDTDHTNNGSDDTVLRFERGPDGAQGDYLIVFEGFTDTLDISDFDII